MKIAKTKNSLIFYLAWLTWWKRWQENASKQGENIRCWASFLIQFYFSGYFVGWKSQTRVTSSDIRVTSLNPRVTSSNLRVTSSNPPVTCSNARVTSSNPRVTSSNSQVTASNPQVTSLNRRVTSSNPRVRKPEPWAPRLKARELRD